MKPGHRIVPVEATGKVITAMLEGFFNPAVAPMGDMKTAWQNGVTAAPPYEVTDEEVGTALTAYFEVIKALEGAPLQAGKSAAAMRHALEDFVRERK